MESKIFVFFTHQFNLEQTQKLLKYLLIIGIETTKSKLQYDISKSTIQNLASINLIHIKESLKKTLGEDRIRKELDQIKGDLSRLTKHFDSKPQLREQSPQISYSAVKNQILIQSEAKIQTQTTLNKTHSDIFSQEQLKWWSSPQQPITKHRSVERNNNVASISNQYPPPQARPRRDIMSLTPKVTESPAPQLQVQKLQFKHHLDDSEIKRTLWDQTQQIYASKQSDQIEKRLFAPVLAPILAPIEQSVCSSQQSQSFHQEEQNRQRSPRFKANEISLTENQIQQKNQKIPLRQKKQKREKENLQPKQQQSFQQQTSKVRRSNPIRSQKSELQTNIQYKYVKSKIKDQIEYDRNTHKLQMQQNQFMGQNQINETQQSQQSLQNESDDMINYQQEKQQTYTTFQMNNSHQDNYNISNRNPLTSVNTKPQMTTNATGTQDEVFQYTMNRPLQLQNQNDTAHIRYISSITSNNSAEATPVNRNREIYSQANTAQSVFLQSVLSNKNEKRTFSSGYGKGRFKSDMRSDDLIEREDVSKMTSERKNMIQQFSGASNNMIELTSQYFNRQSDRNKDINDGSQFQSQDEQQIMEKRLREILAHHDYHSSISSNFSLFNPKDELKNFFQKEFMERQVQEPQYQKFLTSRMPQNNDDIYSSNISFNNGSDQTNKGRNYDQ